MDESQLLIVIALLLYVHECSVWLPPTACCMSKLWYRQRLKVFAGILGNSKGSLVLLDPLPWTVGYVCEEWPASLHPGGILWKDADLMEQFTRFDEISQVHKKDRKVLVGPKAQLRSATPERSSFVTTSIATILQAPVEEREAAILRILDHSMDVRAVRSRWAMFLSATHRLRVISSLFWLSSVVLAFNLFFLGGNIWFVQNRLLLLTAVTFWFFTITEFRRAHAFLYPNDRSATSRLTAMLLVSPFALVRAADTLAQPLFAEFEPIAIAAVLLKPNDLMTFGRSWLAESRYPLVDQQNPDLRDIKTWFRIRYAQRAESIFESMSIDPSSVLTIQNRDVDAVCYCPRCFGQFRHQLDFCPNCRGVPTTLC